MSENVPSETRYQVWGYRLNAWRLAGWDKRLTIARAIMRTSKECEVGWRNLQVIKIELKGSE